MLQNIGQTGIQATRIALGCMRMGDLEGKQAEEVVGTALDLGINFFDHADIYGGGLSELRFRDAIKHLNVNRDKMIIQSKCGIREGYFDFSKEYILSSVDGILERLGTEYLDFLILHRPDVLVEPEEVAEAFSKLRAEGKVKHFGVSNQNRFQMELLQSYLDEPLAVNQLQLSPAHTPMFDAGLNVNMLNKASIEHDDGIVDYCRLKRVTIQAWSPFQIDLSRGLFVNHPDYKELNETIAKLAKNYNVSSEAIVIAWILRHPAKIQAIVGSMNPSRLKAIDKANDIALTREERYDIYRSAGNILP
ncbi:oxidoreductase, aldo/keto reductase family protein [Streptococcus agalactiae ATCC 13813]|uniref:Oxidoreductase, aldo/keto reductase family n=1 Tax=Streptococcus agalactiae TaxID=1311 RepID=A0A7Z7K923_STRAG|nr:aldo/keto reductase [Streptococcus agalactiae]EFV97869.1 oxidoreductase, aldo/keto reductase family protein [Streptococcus agalactiae ATCC 13813]KLL31223.1 aldo/keto reductase [Streptococcus agalactiae]KLL93181.1 aldo/keto reductase [Streptococcus agalactiae]MCC9878595.1 aldo/keto reductase [Streptococcus agalactiae]MCC9896801.1 aldo/keto reductase [Streptococcus agalactiae]